MWNAGDDSGAPTLNDLFRLICQHLSGELQISPIFLCESRADFQTLQIVYRERGLGDSVGPVRRLGDTPAKRATSRPVGKGLVKGAQRKIKSHTYEVLNYTEIPWSFAPKSYCFSLE
jgi:hypothetical protein